MTRFSFKINQCFCALYDESCSVVKSDFDQTSPQNVSNPDVASDGPGSQGESLTDGNAQGVPLRSKGMEGKREREREERITSDDCRWCCQWWKWSYE